MYKIGRPNIYFILLAVLLLNLTILNHIRIFGAKPDLMLICVIFFGMFLGTGAGLESGLVGGALTDIFTLDFFGINMFVFGTTGLLAGILSAKFSRESTRTRVLLVMFLTAFSMTLHFILACIFSKWLSLTFAEYLRGSVIPKSIYTGIVSIPIFLKFLNAYGLRGSDEYL